MRFPPRIALSVSQILSDSAIICIPSRMFFLESLLHQWPTLHSKMYYSVSKYLCCFWGFFCYWFLVLICCEIRYMEWQYFCVPIAGFSACNMLNFGERLCVLLGRMFYLFVCWFDYSFDFCWASWSMVLFTSEISCFFFNLKDSSKD